MNEPMSIRAKCLYDLMMEPIHTIYSFQHEDRDVQGQLQ
jgi:hypothetical protein